MSKDKIEAEGFDILKHSLVPKHIKLSDEEVKELLEKYNISLLQLPTLPHTDAVAKRYGFMPGDIIKVERAGLTRKYFYYRRII